VSAQIASAASALNNHFLRLSLSLHVLVPPMGCSKGPRGALLVFEQLARSARSQA